MLKNVLNNNKIELLIFIIILLSRIVVADFGNSFHSLDAVNYLVAVDDYNIEAERPHLPGYFFYVYFFKLLNLFFPVSNGTFVLFQGIFQAVSGILFYKLIKNDSDIKHNIAITSFLFSIPMVYFFGILSEIYSVDLLFITTYLYLIKKNKIDYLLPFIAIVLGTRQSSGTFLLPSYLYILYIEIRYNKYNYKRLISSTIISLLILASWYIPVINNVGGLTNYLTLLNQQKEILLNYKFINNIISAITYSFTYAIPILLLLLLSKRNNIKVFNKDSIVLILIALPQILIYFLYHYNKGYALLLIPVIILLIIKHYKVNIKFIYSLTILNLLFFYFYPASYPSYNTQIKNEYRENGLYEVWNERLHFWWLPTLSSKNINEDIFNDIEVHKSQIESITNYNSILIDISSILRAKLVAYILYKNEILERSFYTKNSYESHYDRIIFSNKNDLTLKLESGYVLVTKDYYSNFLYYIAEIKLETKYYYLVKITKIEEYLELNKKHCC